MAKCVSVAGAGSGGGLAPIDRPVPTTQTSRRDSGGGTDWNAVFAGTAGSALIIATGAAGVGLMRRRTLAA